MRVKEETTLASRLSRVSWLAVSYSVHWLLLLILSLTVLVTWLTKRETRESLTHIHLTALQQFHCLIFSLSLSPLLYLLLSYLFPLFFLSHLLSRHLAKNKLHPLVLSSFLLGDWWALEECFFSRHLLINETRGLLLSLMPAGDAARMACVHLCEEAWHLCLQRGT